MSQCTGTVTFNPTLALATPCISVVTFSVNRLSNVTLGRIICFRMARAYRPSAQNDARCGKFNATHGKFCVIWRTSRHNQRC
jgi:hypothetical protein